MKLCYASISICIKKEGMFALFFDVDISTLEMIYSLHIFLKNWPKCLYPAIERPLWFMQDCRGFF